MFVMTFDFPKGLCRMHLVIQLCLFYRVSLAQKTTAFSTSTYLVALYSGHHGHAQHSNSVRMAKAIKIAKAMSSQNKTRFSAL